jgi:hypothetical protein
LADAVASALPLAAAVQEYQTVLAARSDPDVGSPGSLVAPTVVPVIVSALPDKIAALAKLSLAGDDGGIAGGEKEKDNEATP